MAGDPAPSPAIARRILALFDGDGEHAYNLDAVHEILEMPLNHLGMVVERHDVRQGPPPESLLTGTRAVLTFFPGDGDKVDWLWPWLETEPAARGMRVLLFGDFGPLLHPGGPEEDPARLASYLARFGLEFDNGYRRGPIGIDVAFADRALCTFESDPRHLAVHRGPRNRSDANRVWVSTTDAFDEEGPRCGVLTGPWGALALDPWTIQRGAGDDERRWFLDPFAFFREALGLEGLPAPDPCLLNGRRVFFLHVDGDGFESLSTVRPGAFSAEVFATDVLDRYPIPATISIIVAGLTDDLHPPAPTRAMEVARAILNRPAVEPASHGVLHPLRWRQPLRPDSPPRFVVWYPAIKNYRYDPVAEVRDSIRFIDDELLAGGRRCKLMLWTGDASPPEEALAECGRLSLLNLNGGVFRADAWMSSLGFVSPLSRRVGAQLQIYAGAANENDFDGFFDTMPGAYGHIDQTLERVGAPRILKPANLYVHFYSAEKPARLAALHQLIWRWAFTEPTAPVFASTYVRAVRSALEEARIEKTAEGWNLRGFGDCPTARIDGETREVDWSRTRGLLGARRLNGSLYLHLAAPDADVVLAASPAPLPHIEQANHALRDVFLDATGVTFLTEAFSRRDLVVAGFPPSLDLAVRIDGVLGVRRSDGDGRLRLEWAPGGPNVVEVRLP